MYRLFNPNGRFKNNPITTYQLYLDAARKYNAGVASGEFDKNLYKPHEVRDEADFDMSVFEFPLTMPPGATLIEEIKQGDKVTAKFIKKATKHTKDT